jgi:hypothetical protein
MFGNIANTALSFRVAINARQFVTVSSLVLVRVISIGQETVSCLVFMLGMKCVLKKKIVPETVPLSRTVFFRKEMIFLLNWDSSGYILYHG